MTIVGKNLPARENGYDLMVLETDMQGNPRGDAVSYTHVGADHLIGGKLEVAVGVPGSLLKTGSVYTAYLVYVDEQDNDTAVEPNLPRPVRARCAPNAASRGFRPWPRCAL